jgi:hypothetical protein
MSRDFIAVNVLGQRKHLKGYKNFPKALKKELVEVLGSWTFRLYDEVVSNIETRMGMTIGKRKEYSGSPYHLKDMVQMEVINEGVMIEGRVYIAGSPYAHIQEKGGTTPAHFIRPKNAKVLAFMSATGHKVFAMHVLHPGATIEPKYFMRDALLVVSKVVTKGLTYRFVTRVKKNAQQ